MIPLYEVPRVVKIINTVSKIMVAKDWGEGRMGSYYLMGTEFLFGNENSSGNGWR